MKMISIMSALMAAGAVSTQGDDAVPGEPWTAPSVEVTSFRVLVRDGWYNMPTDLVQWKGLYWLNYRRGTGHRSENSRVVVLRSNDLRRWHEAKLFESPYGADGELVL